MFPKSENSNNLSNSESYLWQFIQEHKLETMDWAITELSEYAHVSTATIVRTMKKMGYSGYTDFRYSQIKKDQDNTRFSILNSVDDKIKKVIMQNEIEITNTLGNLKPHVIEDTIQLLYQANTIYLFARGLSEEVAAEMQLKFQLVNKRAEFFHDPNIIVQITPTINSSSVVIFVTLSGETKELIRSAQILQKNDVPKIALTCNGNSTISQYIDELFLGFHSSNNYFDTFEVHSRLPLMVIARIILDAYVVRTQENK